MVWKSAREAPLTRSEALEFAARWVAAWNRPDVDAVLAHYVDDATFISPKAQLFVGTPVIRRKAALERYWRTASAKIDTLEFKLERAVWDGDSRQLVVFYEANLNGAKTRSCELMSFDDQGRQVSGEALYGAAV
jgi:ketosteroid isomerase-like protein